MKKLTIIALFFCLTVISQAKSPIIREVGIQTNDFDNFGLLYKWGDTHSMWRINILNLDGTDTYTSLKSGITDSHGDIDLNNFGFALGGGKEYYHDLSDKFSLNFGGACSLGFSTTNNVESVQNSSNSKITTESTTNRITPALSGFLGISYQFCKNTYIGTELRPFVSFTHHKGTTKITTQSSWTTSETNDRSISNSVNYGLFSDKLTFILSHRF